MYEPENQHAAGPNLDRLGLNSPASFRAAESEQSGLSSMRYSQDDESGLWLEGVDDTVDRIRSESPRGSKVNEPNSDLLEVSW